MQIDVVEGPPGGIEADVLVFPVPEPTALPGGAQELDRALEGRLARLVEDGELRGEAGRITILHVDGQISARRIAAAGVGSGPPIADRLRTAAAAAASRTADLGGTTIAWIVEADHGLPAEEQARAVADGVVLRPYQAARWKTDEERRPGSNGSSCAARAPRGQPRR